MLRIYWRSEGSRSAAKRFHALPLEKKLELKTDQYNVGYLAMNASTQRHSTVHAATRPNENESFFVIHDRPLDHPDVVSAKPLRGRNYWPQDLPGFREQAMAYFDTLNALGQKMLPVFAIALAYFHSPNPYRTLKVLPSCIDEVHPPLYPPALYADLVMEFFRANYAHQDGHGSAPMPNRYD